MTLKTNNDIDIKLGPVIKPDKKNIKKFRMTSCGRIVTSLPFFKFMVNLGL